MMDDKVIENYIKSIDVNESDNFKQLISKAYKDGYELCKMNYRWHDYKKNPSDVPYTERYVVLETVSEMYVARSIYNPDGSFYGFTTGLGIFVPCNIIRWKEIDV